MHFYTASLKIIKIAKFDFEDINKFIHFIVDIMLVAKLIIFRLFQLLKNFSINL